MKKKLVLSVLIVALTLLSSCSMYDHTSVTVVNGSDVSLTQVGVQNGCSGVSKIADGVLGNVLENGDTLDPGESITLPLVAVLHKNTNATAVVAWVNDGNDIITRNADFTYTEGASVKITFKLGESTNSNNQDFEITNGELLEQDY